jgi:dynein heavy chain
MFPALVNCCTIDWFAAWPDEALRSVATHFLGALEMAPAVKAGVIDECVEMQKQVRSLSQEYLSAMSRHYYVTPTSYLELIKTFAALISEQRAQVTAQRERYENGLTKLAETGAQVAVMSKELVELQPKLIEAGVATDELIGVVTEKSQEADVEKAFVQKEEAVCNGQAEAAGRMKAECEGDLAEAIPAMESAVKALRTLTKGDIVEVKAMKKPPGAVKLTMEAVCIMMGVKPKMVPDPAGGTKKVADYWEVAQKQLLSDSHFLQNLMEYDKDNVPDAVIDKVRTCTHRWGVWSGAREWREWSEIDEWSGVEWSGVEWSGVIGRKP